MLLLRPSASGLIDMTRVSVSVRRILTAALVSRAQRPPEISTIRKNRNVNLIV